MLEPSFKSLLHACSQYKAQLGQKYAVSCQLPCGIMLLQDPINFILVPFFFPHSRIISNNIFIYLFFLINSMCQDEDAFYRDYAESHKKLSELGFSPRSSGSKGTSDSIILAQSAVGVAVAAAVVILSYFYEVRKRMK